MPILLQTTRRSPSFHPTHLTYMTRESCLYQYHTRPMSICNTRSCSSTRDRLVIAGYVLLSLRYYNYSSMKYCTTLMYGWRMWSNLRHRQMKRCHGRSLKRVWDEILFSFYKDVISPVQKNNLKWSLTHFQLQCFTPPLSKWNMLFSNANWCWRITSGFGDRRVILTVISLSIGMDVIRVKSGE